MKKKRTKLVFILLALSNIIFAKTIQVANPGNNQDIQPNIQTAVNSAVNGDLIQLPAGQFILNKTVNITKFLSVAGQGLGQTILYRSETTTDASLNQVSMFRFNINSATSSGIVISDMTLKSKKPSLVNGDGLSRSVDMGIELIKCVDFVVTRCRFEFFGNGAVSVLHDDNLARGLVYKNEFVHNAKGYDALGLGYGVVVYGVNSTWIADPKFGSSNFIFIEDNLFDYHRHSVAGGGCGLYVFRYNTVKNNIAGNTAHAIDAHEARLDGTGNHYSTRAIEVYNNNIVNTMFKDGTSNCPDGTSIVSGKPASWLVETAICTRGGEALIHDNYIEGYRFGVGLVANNIFQGTYPVAYQQGYLSAVKYGATHTGVDGDKGSGDNYVWNDNYKSYAPTNSQCVYFYNYSSTYIKAERDYHLYAKANYTAYTYPHPLRGSVINTNTLALTTTSTAVSCNGGTNGKASVAVTGGSPGTTGYLYSWSTNPVQTTAQATGLAAGTYTVTVKDAVGNSKTATVTVNQPTLLVLTTSSTPENCGKKDGTATVVASGDVAPYSYLWSNSQVTSKITNLAAGTYTITVTDALNYCAKTAKVVVGSINAPVAAITSRNVSCNKSANGTIQVDATEGVGPYTYEWNTVPVQTTPKVENLAEGTYNVRIIDSRGCATTKSATVAKSTPNFVLSTITTNVSCSTCRDGSASVIVTGATASTYSYNWNSVSNPSIGTSNFATGLALGSYSVTVTDSEGCSKQAVTPIKVAIATGIEGNESDKGDVTVFPNPSSGKFNISNTNFKENESVSVVMYNTAGKEVLVKTTTIQGNTITVDTEDQLEAGAYIVMATSNELTVRKSLIITR